MAKRTAKELAAAQAANRRRQVAKAYAQRDELLVALSKIWPAHLMPTKPTALTAGNDEDWLWSLHLESPHGQLVYPLNNDASALFGHLERLPENTWDGHLAKERSKRLASLRMPASKPIQDI